MTTYFPQCLFCEHFRKEQVGGNFCDAYPNGDGIPKRILENRHDHRKQYHGDGGVRFSPIDEDAERIVSEMLQETGE